MLPILYLGYRIGLGYYYSPAVAYQRDANEIETSQAKAAASSQQLAESISSELIKLAPSIPADAMITPDTVTYRRNASGKIEKIPNPPYMPYDQQELKGTLTRIEPAQIYDACTAITRYSSQGKFDPTPAKKLGAYADCTVQNSQSYIWTGSREKLIDLVSLVNNNLSLNVDLKDSAIKYNGGDCPTQEITINTCTKIMISSPLTYADDNKRSPADSSTPDWKKIFTNQQSGKVSALPSGPKDDNRYILTVSSYNRYHVLYNRSY